MIVFYYFDLSRALDHANYLRTLGYKATVGRWSESDKYRVRLLED